MASSYLDLYSGAGGLRQGGALGSSSAYDPNQFQIGTPQNVYWQEGDTQKVVHDTLNNKYYGTQKQSDLVKGLEDSIARTQAKLSQDSETRYSTGWMGALNSSNYRYTAEDRKAQNAQIASQQKYLEQINNGGYKQEGNQFFDSYDAYTQGWDNVYTSRYNNAQMSAQNEKQRADNVLIDAQNKKTLEANERNKQIKERNARNESRSDRLNTQLYQGDATKSKAKALGISPNTDVNTGMSTEATKISQALLKDNGLSL